MPDYIDLEVEITPTSGKEYRLACRLDYPDNRELPVPRIGTITIDTGTLDRLQNEEKYAEYGNQLGTYLFGGAAGLLASVYQRAKALTAGTAKLRFRLLIDDIAPQLHRLLWETIPEPGSPEGAPLSISRNVFLSRVLQHGRSREFTLRYKNEIRTLVVIANPLPPEGGEWDDEINVDHEYSRVTAALTGLKTKVLQSSVKEPGQASIATIFEELEDNTYDLLYLVCHGGFDTDLVDTTLRLEGASGVVEYVSGRAFATRIERLPNPPSIVVLCSCATAGAGNKQSQSVLASLGPRLVQAGIPAVVAMQGDLSRETAGLFFPKFFRELLKEGAIDRATSLARAEVAEKSDFFVPVLFHRLRSGRVWYGNEEPEGPTSRINWQAQVDSLRLGESVVIFGSAMLDPYLGSQGELAMQLAENYRYAFADSERDDLAMVCQFVENVQGRSHLEDAVCREFIKQIIRESGNNLPEVADSAARTSLVNSPRPHRVLKRLLESRWGVVNKDDDPFSILAQLPFKAYVSTNFDTLIESSMPATKKPEIWRCGKANPIEVVEYTTDTQPTPSEPLVAYLYGTLDQPANLVLTEGDYYKQLSDAASPASALIKSLNNVFTNSALIFLGFRLHEWDFRILYRRLQLMEGWKSHLRFNHVAVQVDPTTARGTGSETVVQRYLTRFFDSSAIEVFRGSVKQFVSELSHRYHT